MSDHKLDVALQRRATLFAANHTDTFRLLNRAADDFPSLAVDKFNDVLIAHAYDNAPPATAMLPALAERVNARAVYVKHRPAEASKLSAAKRQHLAPPIPLWGEVIDETIATENGLRHLIRPGAGLSVGLFLDMRELRAWVRAHATEKMVLNCFAYTCGFGVAALAGGAARA
ncbi:MAG: class I SAM-dependent methyltransferase, partial [Anaerolineales bacterium]